MLVLIDGPNLPDSIQVRIGWAEGHLARLDEMTAEILAGGFCEIARELGDANEHIYRFLQRSPLPPEPALVIGDAVHNIRSILDHAAFLAVMASGPALTAEDQRRIGFPISDTPAKFAEAAREARPVMGEVLDRIEAFQPYQPSAVTGLLALLRDLSNIDKHRRVNVVAQGLGAIDLKPWFDRQIPDMRNPAWIMGPLADGAVILTAQFNGPHPEIDLSPLIRLTLVIDEPAVAAHPVAAPNMGASELLRWILGYARERVLPSVLV